MYTWFNCPPPPLPPREDALEGRGPPRPPPKRLDRRLEAAEAVGSGYCRLQMPLKLALSVRETVAGQRLGALEESVVKLSKKNFFCKNFFFTQFQTE